jgi:hypothetical protein
MASFATLPLMDASRDSRIHDWIAEQYSFALSEFQEDRLWRDDPPSLRESKLLPDDFEIIAAPPPPPQRDTDSDRDSQSTHSYEPPLLPSPLPLACDPQSPHLAPQGSTNVEDALDGLIREMNSWRLAPGNRSALTLTLSDRNKVCLAPIISPSTLVHAQHSGTSRTAIFTSDTLTGRLPLSTGDCPIIPYVLYFPYHPQVFFPSPASAFECSRPLPPHP